MKTGFIGAGNMATAMLKGFVESGRLAAKDVLVYDVNKQAAANLAGTLGVKVAGSNKALARDTELVFLCVKPQMMAGVLEEIAPCATQSKTFVSIAAGLSLDFFEKALGRQTAIIRLMPNVNMMVGQSMTALCPNAAVTPDAGAFVEELVASMGRVTRLEEKHFPIFSAIAGCSPAYTFLFIDAMARTAVEYGIPKAQATEIAAQAVLGSAVNLLGSDEVPWAMIDKVCSPGGTTVAGLAALQEAGFAADVAKGIRAAREKDVQLGKELAR